MDLLDVFRVALGRLKDEGTSGSAAASGGGSQDLPPRGFRVKKAMEFPPKPGTVLPIASKPSAADR